MIAGIVKSEKISSRSIYVSWTIGTIGPRDEIEEGLKHESVPFYFAGQMWQLLISKGILEYIVISRITVSTHETPDFPVVCWNIGILDKMDMTHYGRTGFVRLEMASKWVTVADCYGPLFQVFEDLRTQNHLYMPGDKITIALRLILESSDAVIKVKDDPTPMPEQINIISGVVAINVSDNTFYANESILHGISGDFELKTSEWIRGRMTVIDLPDCDPDDFECFLSFKDYGEFKELSNYKARKVYDIADKFQDTKLKTECVQIFLRTLNVSSVCEFLEMAERDDDRELKEGCSEYFLKNIGEIVNTSGWFEFLKTRTKVANDLIKSYFNSTGR